MGQHRMVLRTTLLIVINVMEGVGPVCTIRLRRTITWRGMVEMVEMVEMVDKWLVMEGMVLASLQPLLMVM
jgi:hypothetical protein